MRYIARLLLALALLFGTAGLAQTDPAADTAGMEATQLLPPAPVTNLTGRDRPNDHGHSIFLNWTPSVDDFESGTVNRTVLRYRVMLWWPNDAYRVDTLRQMFNQLRNGQPTEGIYKSPIDTSLAMLDRGITNADLLPYRINLPEGIDRTDAPVDMMRELLTTKLTEITTPITVSKDSVKVFRRMFLDSLQALTPAFAAYPNGGSWDSVGTAPPGSSDFRHAGSKDEFSIDFLPDFTDLYYRVDAVTLDQRYAESDVAGPLHSSGQWYNSGRTVVLVSVLLFTVLTVFFVQRARKGKQLYVRPLSGIEAVDDAIGRATEMGKPILYVLGLGSASDIATIASFTILSRVAKRVAEYQTSLIVPTYDPIVMSVAQEVVKSSYMDAGRPDDYNEDMVFFVTQSQFAYVAAVNGIMLRQLPATNVYMGKFYAESLILAETGALAGSIQIAGTDEIAQIPFFVVACDYTLIGEELYAASAYLGGEPILLGSLKAQDYAKALFVICAIFVFLLLALGDATGSDKFDWFKQLFHVAD
jgi:hypothetical protein